MENEVKYPWLIYEVSDYDYLIWWIENVVIPQNINTTRHFYNQATKRNPSTSWSCWLFWSMWVISDLTWYQFTETDINAINNKAIKSYWLALKLWMTMYRAVDCVRDYWNEQNPNKKLSSYRFDIWDKLFAEALRKWHTMVVWYKTSNEYLKDSQDDWVISWEDFKKWSWHLVRVLFNKNILITDNYYWTKKYNEYIVNKINKLKENWVYFTSAYLFLYDKTMTNIIRDNIKLENAKIGFDLWLWNWLNPQSPMSREEAIAVIVKAIWKWK